MSFRDTWKSNWELEREKRDLRDEWPYRSFEREEQAREREREINRELRTRKERREEEQAEERRAEEAYWESQKCDSEPIQPEPEPENN